MKTVSAVVSIVFATLLLCLQPAVAAGPAASFTADLAVVVGAGQLEDTTNFSVSALSFVAVVGTRVINVQNGSLVLNGVATDCTIDSVAPDCSEATLLCEEVTHVVTPGVRGGSHGSLDGIAVAHGRIRLFCKHSPALPR